MASSSGSSGWSRDGSTRQSPIAYRTRPLDYEPAVYCLCQRKAALWISWSDENPGRRYLKCYRAREGGCNFIRWYEDSTTTEFVKKLLVDLRNKVGSLKAEIEKLENDNRLAVNCCTQLRSNLAETTNKLAETANKLAAHDLAADQNKTTIEALNRWNTKLEAERLLWMGCCVALSLVVVVMWFRM